jgi:hypothetical protein
MTKSIAVLHVASVFLACTLYGCLYLCPHIGVSVLFVVNAIGASGAIGFATGLAMMAKRKGESESILLAISTIAAFMIMMMGFCTPVIVT